MDILDIIDWSMFRQSSYQWMLAEIASIEKMHMQKYRLSLNPRAVDCSLYQMGREKTTLYQE
jgi:hypothetical protein